MEQTNAQTGTGVLIDGDLAGKPSGIIVEGNINNFSVGVQLNGQALKNTIGPTITSTLTPIALGTGVSISSNLILSTTNYTTGVAVGSQIPTDLTLSTAEATPAAPAAGRRLFSNSSSNSGDLTSESSGGAIVDLETHGVTTQGDIIYANSASPPALTRLAVGASGSCLTSNGSTPGWSSGNCSVTVGTYDQTGLSATKTQSLLTTTAVGHFTVNVEVEITATDASGATVQPSATCTGDGTARSRTGTSIGFTNTNLSSTVVFPCYVDASTNISISATVTGTPVTATYALHAWVVQQ